MRRVGVQGGSSPVQSPGPGGNFVLKSASMPVGMSINSNTGLPEGTPGGMSTTMPSFSGVTSVSTKAELDAAVLTVPNGGIIEITANIDNWTGATNLPNRGVGFNAQIRGSNHSGLPTYSGNYLTCTSANRVNPVTHAASLRRITQTSTNTPVFRFDNAAEGWWITGLTLTPTAPQTNSLIEIKGRTSHTSEADCPRRITIDRCYIHHQGNNLRRPVQLDGLYILVSGSVFDIGIDPGGSDCQALAAFNGGGYVLAFNNDLQACSENILVGGSAVTIPNYDHHDWALIRNYWSKDPAWEAGTNQVKNLWEMKHMVRCAFIGNVCENSYNIGQAQPYAVVTNVSNQTGANTWATVTDIVYWANKFLDINGSTFDWAMRGSNSNANLGTHRIEFAHNWMADCQAGTRQGIVLGGTALPTANGIAMYHNIFQHVNAFLYWANPNLFSPSSNFDFSDNVNRSNLSFGPMHADGGTTNHTILNAIFNTSWTCRNNWKPVDNPEWGATLLASPHLNQTYAVEADMFTDAANMDFTIKASHAAFNSCVDGTSPGPNYTLLNALITGVA